MMIVISWCRFLVPLSFFLPPPLQPCPPFEMRARVFAFGPHFYTGQNAFVWGGRRESLELSSSQLITPLFAFLM